MHAAFREPGKHNWSHSQGNAVITFSVYGAGHTVCRAKMKSESIVTLPFFTNVRLCAFRDEEETVVEKRQPLSLDELIAKRNAEQAAESKPVFLSKEERAALAMKRRAEQVEAQAQASFSDRERRKMNEEVCSTVHVKV